MQAIPLRGKRAAGRVALVDDADAQLVSGYRWHVIVSRHTSYAQTRHGPNRCRIYMHILIMGQRGIDHIDGDGLNNQRANLRPATQSQNLANQRPVRGGTSRFKGVYWRKDIGRWQAYISFMRHCHRLGYFDSEEAAAHAYDAAARTLHGEYARPNFPEGD